MNGSAHVDNARNGSTAHIAFERTINKNPSTNMRPASFIKFKYEWKERDFAQIFTLKRCKYGTQLSTANVWLFVDGSQLVVYSLNPERN